MAKRTCESCYPWPCPEQPVLTYDAGGEIWPEDERHLTPSADLPACRDEDPVHTTALATAEWNAADACWEAVDDG